MCKQRIERINKLKTLIKNKILVLDGATGTALQTMNLTPKHFGGEKLDGCNEHLIFSSPETIAAVHNGYLKAGADIIETNTFGATPVVLEEYNLQNDYYEINLQAARLARKCADDFTKEDNTKPRFVAGSMGPTTKAISVTGGITFSELISNFQKQAKALYEGEIDYYLIETSQDTRNIKAAIIAISNFQDSVDFKLPIAVSVTIENSGTMLAGQTPESLMVSLEHQDLLYVGLNCATGPKEMKGHIRTMATMSDVPIGCVPNAGLPDENGKYLESPSELATVLENYIDEGYINLVGGCCGTTFDHIRSIAEMAKHKVPKSRNKQQVSKLSGIDILEITDEARPILVGERTNSIGSKKFRTLISDNKIDEAAEIAKAQVSNGAQIIDICLANPDRNELEDIKKFLEKVIHKIKVPLMIDSTDPKVIDAALSYSQGKAIINSINLENGEKRFNSIVPLAKKYGAALVVGTIDEDPENGMAITRERKLEIAKRSYKILTEKFGFNPADIYFDPLVFPCATGDDKYAGSAIETIEALAIIKKEFPKTKSAIGVSNVSFGLPAAGREVLNSVFLYHCVQAGLDLAIVNTQKIKRYSSLTDEEISLANKLLNNSEDNIITTFANFYRDKKTTTSTQNNHSTLSVEEQLHQHILEGMKTGITQKLDKLLKDQKPMSIINGPLMDGMAKVGKLFNQNKLIVAEVLQSAEVMKTAVDYLKEFMETTDITSKGKIVLATVKGDVHDIGKNLVDIVLSNNGFEVINIGIKITSDQLIKAIKEHNPDFVGLSGLLVKSTQEMAQTAKDLTDAGINIPLLLGGAALTKNFVTNQIGPLYPKSVALYAKDAMTGLHLANIVTNPVDLKKITEEQQQDKPEKDIENNLVTNQTKQPKVSVKILSNPPTPSNYQRNVDHTSIDEIFKYINYKMLLSKHLGISGKHVDLITSNQFNSLKVDKEGNKAIEIYQEVLNTFEEYKDSYLTPSAIYQFFRANSTNGSINLFDHNDTKIETLSFPSSDRGENLSRYLTEQNDSIAMFVVSIGKDVAKEATRLKQSGDFLKSHILSALALQLAEAYAELIHKKIREEWDIKDPDHLTIKDIFQSKYRGKRYSFGYSACPNLEDQKILFKMLLPEELGIELTDGLMMSPESSVSAICFHHPDAKYF